jgi:hypothetical protein
MAGDNLALVHTDIVYLGGEYDEVTGRAFYGGEWKDRIDSAVEEYDNLFSVAYLDEGADASLDDEFIKRPRELKDRTHLPYAFGNYEHVIEDSDNGNVSDTQLENLTSGADTLTVAGVWLNDCVSNFIESVIEYDPDIEIEVDPAYSAVRPDTLGPDGLGNLNEVRNRSVDEVERKRAESPPSAVEKQDSLEEFRKRFSEEERVSLLEEKL